MTQKVLQFGQMQNAQKDCHTTICKTSDHSHASLTIYDVTGVVVHSHIKLWLSLLCTQLAKSFTVDQVAQIFASQASYDKDPDYFLLKTAIFSISVFLLLSSMKFGTELENV